MLYRLPAQGVLAPEYELYREAKGGVVYKVPQGSEIELFRKVGRPSSHDVHILLPLMLWS